MTNYAQTTAPSNIGGTDNPNAKSMASNFQVLRAEEKGNQYLLTIKHLQNGKEEQVRISK